ncbi:MAG: hypothetical protein ABSF45_20310 [Terriglobia bacterium]|jgi:hypothetical protein
MLLVYQRVRAAGVLHATIGRRLGLESFWEARLRPGQEEVAWAKEEELLVVNWLVSRGSEFRLHRQGFDQTAMGDLLETGARPLRGTQPDGIFR